MEQKIVILGCGFSGMLTALSFAKQNIKTTILEYQSINSSNFCNDIRTTALTPASVQFLKDIDLWQELKAVASKMLEIYVVDNKAPEMIHLSSIRYLSKLAYAQGFIGDTERRTASSTENVREDSSLGSTHKLPAEVEFQKISIEGNEALGYIVKNSEFKKILLDKTKDNPLINIIDQCDYQKIDSKTDHSIIYLNNQQIIKSDLLVVCDGRNSKARQYYFFNKIDKSYEQVALTFDIRHEKDHENCAVEHFMPSGPFAVLPLKDPKCSSVIWTTKPKQSELLLSLPNEEFEYLVNRNCGNSLGAVTVDSNISSFPLKARIANRYFHNRIVIVADSAHIIHPLAGQALNQGIKDIDTLTRLVSYSVLSEEMLEQYQKLRKNDNFHMYMITEGLNRLFSNHSAPLWYLRRAGFKILDNIPPIKNLLVRYAMGKR